MEDTDRDDQARHDVDETRDDRSPERDKGGVAFDLSALCLSPLTSPAMTTAASGSEGFSVLSDGLSLATDDKNDDHGAASSDHDETGRLHGEENDELENGGGYQGEENESEEKEPETPRQSLETNGDEQQKGLPQLDVGASAIPSLQLGAPHDGEEFTLPPQSVDNRQSDSDDDLTVECASPRDPVEVEESEPHRLDPRGTPAVGTTLAELLRPAKITGRAPEARETSASPEVPFQAKYSHKTMFPVVYEKQDDLVERTTVVRKHMAKSERNDTAVNKRAAVATTSIQHSGEARVGPRSTGRETDDFVKSQRHPALKDQMDSTAKALKLQLQVAEADRKQLTQRNARLKSQLEQLTADLVRTKADAAKWKTENDLYAAKMPKLQAELSEETTLVDEKQAQTIQSQLENTQLRAKVQVLQTRAGNLDTQVEKLQHEWRVVKKEARRRAILQQHSDEKVKRLEIELHEAKASHAHELQLNKQKFVATTQRLEHERVKAVAEAKKTLQQQLEEMRAALAKATKKWKELEHLNATREQELMVLKKRGEDFDEDVRTRDRQAKTAESLLARADRTEASLRCQVAALKAQLQLVEREKSKALRVSGATAVPKPLRPRPTTQPSRASATPPPPRARPLNVPSANADDLLCSCCHMVRDSIAKAERLGELDEETPVDSDQFPPVPKDHCARCDTLGAELNAARDELQQVRVLHANELKVQATALERVLVAFRGGADGGRGDATMACA